MGETYTSHSKIKKPPQRLTWGGFINVVCRTLLKQGNDPISKSCEQCTHWYG